MKLRRRRNRCSLLLVALSLTCKTSAWVPSAVSQKHVKRRGGSRGQVGDSRRCAIPRRSGGGRLLLSAAPAIESSGIADMAWPTRMMLVEVEPGDGDGDGDEDELLPTHIAEQPKGPTATSSSTTSTSAAAPTASAAAAAAATTIGPATEENQEGRGQQGFEGPEKTLEMEFDPDVGHEDGLRAIRREQWDAILEQAQCRILHQRGNDHFDSYVLSESSLFVYKSKLVLKTCGTTTLLRCLPLLTVVSKSYGLNLEWIGYSRRDFTFPADQIYPHTSFAEEVDFLQSMFAGSAYVHGPLNGDHWYTYVADDWKKPASAAADRTLNLMMYDLEPEVAQKFYKSEHIQTAEDVSSRSGIKSVLPNAALQGHLFEPCGYSMNALEGRAYYTVHVTPEPDFSYASFETNVCLPDYNALVRGVLEVFRPKKFTMTLLGEDSGMEDIKQNPFDYSHIACSSTSAGSTGSSPRYERALKTTTNFSGDYTSQMGNWVRAAPATPPLAAAQDSA